MSNKSLQQVQSAPSPVASAFSGGMAGCIGKTFVAPLTRLTMLYQVSTAMDRGSSRLIDRNSALKSMRRLAKEEGLRSFWNGNLTAVIHRFPYSGTNFMVFESCRVVTTESLGLKESAVTRLLCGGVAACVATCSVYPLDLIRTRLTVQDGHVREGNYRGILHGLQSIVEKEGMAGLYRGLGVSLSVSVPSLAIGYSIYGTVKEFALRGLLGPVATTPQGQLTTVGSLAAGSTAGITSTLLTFPADVVRRRLQVQGLATKVASVDETQRVGHSFNQVSLTGGAREEVLSIYRSEGFRGLYRGILPEMCKVAPMVGITFCAYEFITQATSGRF
jgi:hypothetical protein